MNLILLEAGELDGDGRVRLDDARGLHVVRVLRATVGQTVHVGLVNGPVGSASIEAVSPTGVDLRVTLDANAPPRPRVDLLLALPRPKVLQRLWSQLAALGVDRVLLTNAARVERHYFDTHVLDQAVYLPRLKEGLQQARDTWVPRVSVHRRLRVLVEDDLDTICDEGRRLVTEPGAPRSIRAALSESGPPSNGRVLVAVGPEGGWSAYELDLLGAHGFEHVGLGPRTLRSDTATVAVLALVHDALEAAARRR